MVHIFSLRVSNNVKGHASRQVLIKSRKLEIGYREPFGLPNVSKSFLYPRDKIITFPRKYYQLLIKLFAQR